MQLRYVDYRHTITIMSTPGLFVPTYGRKSAVSEEKDGVAFTAGAKQTSRTGTTAIVKKSRPLPAKSMATSQPKRSLLPSLVFNGHIEYVQVCVSFKNYCTVVLVGGVLFAVFVVLVVVCVGVFYNGPLVVSCGLRCSIFNTF